MSHTLNGKTLFITGGSRGIGRAIALAAAKEGANIVIAAKSAEPHPKLPGTIHSVAEEVRQAGGKALPLMLDVRDDEGVVNAMAAAAGEFGGIDIVINNAGAIRLKGVEKVELKRVDLMYQINTRAVIATAQAALPWLKTSANPHILSLSPPINLNPKWLKDYAPYTLTKYGMTLLTIGMAEEFRRYGIAVNSLWPRTLISTAAIEFEAGGPQLMARGRQPEIMADAALAIFRHTDCAMTGQAVLDEQVLEASGVSDFERYRYDPKGTTLLPDLFLDD